MKTNTKILILDDSPDLLDALVMFLERHHFNVCAVTSDELFKTQLKRFKPDVIILDVYINGHANGRDICRAIKSSEDTKHIPVMLMSASIKALHNFEECHADAIIDKPFDLAHFHEKIRSLVSVKTKKSISSKRTNITGSLPWLNYNQDEKQLNVQL